MTIERGMLEQDGGGFLEQVPGLSALLGKRACPKSFPKHARHLIGSHGTVRERTQPFSNALDHLTAHFAEFTLGHLQWSDTIPQRFDVVHVWSPPSVRRRLCLLPLTFSQSFKQIVFDAPPTVLQAEDTVIRLHPPYHMLLLFTHILKEGVGKEL